LKFPLFIAAYILLFSLSLSAALAQTTEEAGGLILKGTKTFTLRGRTVEGSLEGEAEGSTSSRDETLRLNISGKTAGTEVDATVISTSTTGTDVTSQREDKVSILLRRSSTEVYWGDFTANFDDVEFAGINKVLSGLRVSGDYDKWGFKAIASSPRGESKSFRAYGDGTQGPYSLGYAPVVVDSEKVWVDGVSQRRGDDYDIDYEGGTITFRKRTIIETSIIKVDFDYRSTPYRHSTYGMRLKGDVGNGLSLGTTYINDSDSLRGAEEQRDAMTSDPVDPVSHQLFGVDGSYQLGPELKVDSEFAYSEKNPDLLGTSGETVYRDRAFKVNTSSDMGAFSFATRYKRIGPDFSSIADADPKQDLHLFGGDAAYRPNGVFYAESTYDNQKYVQGDVLYKYNGLGAKAELTPDADTGLKYLYNQLYESNDAVSGDTFDRLSVRNAAEATRRTGFLRHILSGSHERRVRTVPSEEVTAYRIAGYGASTVGFENFSAGGNVELKETEDPSGDTSLAKTYIMNLSASPAREYFASAGINHIDDSRDGETTVTDLSYRAEPVREVRTEGKYTISSIKEEFGSTPEVVSRQTGSFRVNLRPVREVRLRHTYKPSFTFVRRLGVLSFNDNSNQSEVTWAPDRRVSTGIIYRVEDMFSFEKASIDRGILDEKEKTWSTTMTLKAAPIRIMSVEFNYILEKLFSSRLSSPEALIYDDAAGNSRNFEAAVRTSLSEWFSLDSMYLNEKIDLGSTDPSDDINTMTQTGSVKGTWNLDRSWSVYMSGAYSETIDNHAADEPFTYTISPGVGFIYRLLDQLRVEASYDYSRSYLGSRNEKMVYALKVNYDANEYVHITFNMDHEHGTDPYYKVTDFTGNVEIDI